MKDLMSIEAMGIRAFSVMVIFGMFLTIAPLA
jgi:hypothetical protein